MNDLFSNFIILINKTKYLYIMQVGRILESNIDAICKKVKLGMVNCKEVENY